MEGLLGIPLMNRESRGTQGRIRRTLGQVHCFVQHLKTSNEIASAFWKKLGSWDLGSS